METPFLSVLIPSKRPDKLRTFLATASFNTYDKSMVEFIVGIDDNEPMPVNDYGLEIKFIKVRPKQTASHYMEMCYKSTNPKSKWILFCNDDIEIETLNWEDELFQKTLDYPDEVALFWLNDNMFKNMLSCFPVISRKVINKVNLFPMSYKQYKIDDTIFDIFPPERRFYLENIRFTHNNDQGETGYKLPDGRIYPINIENGRLDEEMWAHESSRRKHMKDLVYAMIDGAKAPRSDFDISKLRILIGVSTAEFARRADFYDYFNMIDKPIGTAITFAHGQSPATNRNLIIEQALNNNCTHILFIDDDVLVKPDILHKLARHNKDIVSGLYLMRNFPHRPIVFDKAEPNGRCHYLNLNGDKGLIEIAAAGLGAVLIKTEIFRALEKPWIRLGELESDKWCDDIGFFKRVREAGFKSYCDLDCIAGHIASVAVWPNFMNNEWYTNYDTTGSGTVSVPQQKSQAVVS